MIFFKETRDFLLNGQTENIQNRQMGKIRKTLGQLSKPKTLGQKQRKKKKTTQTK